MSFSSKFRTRFNNIRLSPNRWRMYVLLGIVLYFIAINQIIHIRPDHAFLALAVFSLALGKKKSKQFLIDWSPFIFFWVAYDMMRGVADSVRHIINVVPPFKLELILFGPLFGGQIPSWFFEHYQAVHDGSLGKIIL
ncbi:hypothetical protein KA005_23380, partial [bacterium]|nr:hypothetical protein [bacterium]